MTQQLTLADLPAINVLVFRTFKTATNKEADEVLPLAKALERKWSDEACTCAWSSPSIRLTKKKGRPTRATIQLGFGDLDFRDHSDATPADFDRLLPQLAALEYPPAFVYPTPRGARSVWLTEPLTDADQFEKHYTAFLGVIDRVLEQQSHGYRVDFKTVDWTRLWLLPNVKRDGKNSFGHATHVLHLDPIDLTRFEPRLERKPRGSRTFGNGKVVTDDERERIVDASRDDKGKISVGLAAMEVHVWFAGQENPVVFEATAPLHGNPRYYYGRYWALYSEIVLRADLDWLFAPFLSFYSLTALIETLKPKLAIPCEQFNQQPSVVLGDCILEISDYEIRDHEAGFQPSDLITTGLDFSPEPIPTPQWDAMLDLMMPDADNRKTLQEVFGYAPFPSLSLQVFVLFHGQGGTGKDTTLAVLRRIIGEKRVSALPLNKLSGTHAAQSLAESVINIDAEAELLDRAGELFLKQITGESPLEINPKFKTPYSKTLPTKFFLACNSMPHLHDKTDAIWQRPVIVPFNVKIPADNRKRISEIIAELEPELPGILHWAIEGLRRVLATRKGRSEAFTQSAQAKALLEDHRRSSNTFLLWWDERVVVGDNFKVEKLVAYLNYKDWHSTHGYRQPLTDGSFGREVLRQPGIASGKPHSGPRIYKGFRVRAKNEAAAAATADEVTKPNQEQSPPYPTPDPAETQTHAEHLLAEMEQRDVAEKQALSERIMTRLWPDEDSDSHG
jgi:P4 family phage/plasmid primase-like protien